MGTAGQAPLQLAQRDSKDKGAPRLNHDCLALQSQQRPFRASNARLYRKPQKINYNCMDNCLSKGKKRKKQKNREKTEKTEKMEKPEIAEIAEIATHRKIFGK